WAPRVVADGLVSTEEATKGIRLLGIDPQKESSVTTLKNRVIEGDWLETVSEGAVLGKGLKEALDARIGDSLVVMVQGRYGGLTGALIPVVGILRTGWPEIDRTTLFVRLEQAQTMLNLDDAILEIALRTTDLRKVPAVVIWLNQNLSSRWETHTWSELLPEIEQMIRFDRVGGQIFIAILLLVVLFGALNTVLMSVVERARELRMMLAVGMTPGSLGRMVAIETGIMLLIGMVLGHIIAAPINLYLAANPIYFTGETAAMIEEIGWEPMVTSQYTWLLVGSSTLMMAAIGLVVVLWPLKRIYQIRTIKERE
ncbi:MAG: hypothetical protein QGH20_03420, partial [Candidatus Latescibacteria bacterium]|nr:hypothetical protein [Candidatus Latescibacterota bacterium]